MTQPAYEAAVRENFKGHAVTPIYSFIETVKSFLNDKGFTNENTITAVSTCPDEANRTFDAKIVKEFGGFYFHLGGLSGVPFTGLTGFGAYLSHAPSDDGRLVVISATHVGVTDDGTIGQLCRAHMHKTTTACGAIYKAWQDISGGEEVTEHPLDPQQHVIYTAVKDKHEHLLQFEGDTNKLGAELAYVLQQKVSDSLLELVSATEKGGTEIPQLVHISGILVNTSPELEDFFVPVSCTHSQRGASDVRTDWTEELAAKLNDA